MAQVPAPTLAYSLLRAADWFNDALLEHLAESGWPRLNRSQSLVMAELDGGPLRPAELARRAGMTRQSMQSLLESLVAWDLVTVEPDPAHGRALLARLTDAGRRLVGFAGRTLLLIEDELALRIGAAAVDDLRAVLGLDWGAPPGPYEPLGSQRLVSVQRTPSHHR